MSKNILAFLISLTMVFPFAGVQSSAQTPSDEKWIGCTSGKDVLTGFTVAPARYLRKEFNLSAKVRLASMSICGLGLYDVWINGVQISKDQVLSPTVSDYRKRVYYNTFDVTSALKKGGNAIGVVLGNGRYFSMRVSAPGVNIPNVLHFDVPKLWLRIDIIYKDGGEESFYADETWKISVDGPIQANNEYDGETYDARNEFGQWTKTGFNDSGWKNASILAVPGGKLELQPNPNIAIQDRLKPVSVKKSGDCYILDMGQNMVGWLQVKAKGIAAGDTLRMRFAETLNPDGTLYMANLRQAKVTDTYISKGTGSFTWHPEFVYHGFRFVEVKGLKKAPKLSDFEGQVFYDKMKITGHFETSNDVVNQVYRNAFWGIRGNYRGMPTDCPQRDERMGWMGDRGTGCYGESYIFDNHALYSKWLTDIEDSETPEGHLPNVAPVFWAVDSDNFTWPGVFITAADMLYWRYGDTQPIIDHYDAMKKWMTYMEKTWEKDGIVSKDTYGDWCMPPESLELIHSKDPSRITSAAVLSTAFHYYLLGKMVEFAGIAGHPEDAAAFKAKAESVKNAFNAKFFNEKDGTYDNNTVTADLLPLYFGMVPQGREQDVFKNIVKKTEVDCGSHVSCGLVGIMFLMRTLTEYGRPDLAFKIASNDTYPSWGYMAKNGATTIWELWNGNTADPAMNSGNHVMLLGDLIIWEYEYLGGIRPLEPGFKSIELKPYPAEGLDWVKCSYDSPCGKISSSWKCTGGKFEWDVTVPEGTTAKAYVPGKNGQRDLKELAPGSYHFTSYIH